MPRTIKEDIDYIIKFIEQHSLSTQQRNAATEYATGLIKKTINTYGTAKAEIFCPQLQAMVQHQEVNIKLWVLLTEKTEDGYIFHYLDENNRRAKLEWAKKDLDLLKGKLPTMSEEDVLNDIGFNNLRYMKNYLDGLRASTAIFTIKQNIVDAVWSFIDLEKQKAQANEKHQPAPVLLKPALG